MCKSSLPDGCTSDEYAGKCYKLLHDHMPNFERVRLEGRTLVQQLIDFMPEVNRRTDQAVIWSELKREGKEADWNEALRVCIAAVSRSADPARAAQGRPPPIFLPSDQVTTPLAPTPDKDPAPLAAPPDGSPNIDFTFFC